MADKTPDHSAPAFSRLEVLTGIIAVGVLALLLGIFALTRPVDVVKTQNLDYTHTGRFSYSAEARGESPYGPEGLSAGEPILTDLVGRVTTRFAYKLKTDAGIDVSGTASLVAEVQLPQGLSREFTIQDEQEFTGSDVAVSGILPLRDIRNYVKAAQVSFAEGGFMSATVTLRPVVRVAGVLGGEDLESKFTPELVMNLDGSALAVSQSVEATSASGGQASSPLRASEKETVERDTTVTNTMPLLVAEPTVPMARGIGFGVAGVCLLAGLWIARPLLRGSDPANESARIRTLYGAHLIEVSDLSLRDGPVARVGSMDALVDLAKKYESKIMHVAGSEGDTYSVWDNGLLYEYRPNGTAPTDELLGKHADLPHVNGSKPIVNGKKAPHKAKT